MLMTVKMLVLNLHRNAFSIELKTGKSGL